VDNGLPANQAEAIADDYGEAQLHGLERSIGAIAIFAMLSFWFTRRLPARALDAAEAPAPTVAVPQAAVEET
jgi:hypothetical protein